MWQNVIDRITFPGSFLFLCGSTAKGSASDNSDIDFICCTDYASYVYSEQFLLNGKRIQVIFFPRQKLQDYLICDSYSRDCIYNHMWSNALNISYDSSFFLLSIQQYIYSMQNLHRAPLDDYIVFLKQKLSRLCEELMNPSNDQVLISSELLLTIVRLISGKTGSIKHIGREIADNNIYQRFQHLYLDAISSRRYSCFYSEVQEYINMISEDDGSSTTSLSYNIIPNGLFIVYFPGYEPAITQNNEIVLMGLESELDRQSIDSHYSFKVEQNQALDAGLYLCVFDEAHTKEEVYKTVLSYHKKNAEHFLDHDIKMLYPYRTAFTSGFFFGGLVIQKHLTPLFYSISSEIARVRKSSLDGSMLSISTFIYEVFAEEIHRGKELIASLRDSIVADAVDLVGVYNIDQCMIMSNALKKVSLNSEYVLCPKPVEPLLKLSIKQILNYVNHLGEDDILFPSLTPNSDKHEVLFRYILIHLQDILRLNYQERYKSMSFFLSNYK